MAAIEIPQSSEKNALGPEAWKDFILACPQVFINALRVELGKPDFGIINATAGHFMPGALDIQSICEQLSQVMGKEHDKYLGKAEKTARYYFLNGYYQNAAGLTDTPFQWSDAERQSIAGRRKIAVIGCLQMAAICQQDIECGRGTNMAVQTRNEYVLKAAQQIASMYLHDMIKIQPIKVSPAVFLVE